jgi:hemerythrin-like domain-containing protein
MKLLEDLRREHELIAEVLGSFRTYVDQLLRHDASLDDGLAFVAFFEIYAGAFHHEREEEILFPALVDSGIDGQSGPLKVLLSDHDEFSVLIGRIKLLLERPLTGAVALDELEELAIRYTRGLWQHIDAENSVLLPESEEQLRRSGVLELEGRGPDETERTASVIGRQLILRYPPTEDTELVRGEGCAMCRAYGEGCAGIEREWWNDWKWEELEGHVAAS